MSSTELVDSNNGSVLNRRARKSKRERVCVWVKITVFHCRFTLANRKAAQDRTGTVQ